MKKEELLKRFVTFPEDYQLVEMTDETRNNQKVTILRFQKDGLFRKNGPRIIGIFAGTTLVSLKNLTSVPVGKLTSTVRSEAVAEALFFKANPDYAASLSFIRTEHQQRQLITDDGQLRQFPVLWVKFAHDNGSYNWVTLGAENQLIELEIDSRWDYFRGRRQTEMWDNDDWVLARAGKGPQLASPNALA